jgi:hypothetical protein
LRGEISDKTNYKVYSQINNTVYTETKEQLYIQVINQIKQNMKL